MNALWILILLRAAVAFTAGPRNSRVVFDRPQSTSGPSPPRTAAGTKRTAALGPAEAWQVYTDALEASPLLIKSVTAGLLLGAADLTGQALERRTAAAATAAASGDQRASPADAAAIDWARAARFAVFGLVLQAPWNHFYYQVLDGALPPTAEPFTATNGAKVLIDQFLQAPVFTVLIFVFLGLLEGKTPEAIKRQLESDYRDTIVANWKLWVPATVVNIGFVPPLLRVLFLNVVFFGWSIFLSLKLNKKDDI